MALSEIKPESSENFLVSKTQMVILAIVLILTAVFFLGRQFGLFQRERIAIPSGQPYAEARVVGVHEDVVLAERTVLTDIRGNVMPKKMEILTNEKTVFAKITSLGPVKIFRESLQAGDVIFVYNHIRTLEEVLKAPADPELAIPLGDIVKNPRERIKADFVVKVGK